MVWKYDPFYRGILISGVKSYQIVIAIIGFLQVNLLLFLKVVFVNRFPFASS